MDIVAKSKQLEQRLFIVAEARGDFNLRQDAPHTKLLAFLQGFCHDYACGIDRLERRHRD